MAYALISDMMARFDSRTLAQESNDSDGKGGNTANLQAALDDASGEILAAVLVAGLYTSDEIASLAAARDPFLIRLTTTLAVCFLWSRRMESDPPVDIGTGSAPWVQAQLVKLQTGTLLLNIPSNPNISAGLPSVVTLTNVEQIQKKSMVATPFFETPYDQITVHGPNCP